GREALRVVEERARDRPRVGPRLAHVGVGGAARMQVTLPARVAPAGEAPVAAVLGRPVHRLERVREGRADEGLEVAVGLVGEQEILLRPGRVFEVDADGLLRSLVQEREPGPVDFLKPGDRAGELALREALAALEPDAPAE